jgi:hypothetical protein
MLEALLLANAATGVVSRFLKTSRRVAPPSTIELSPEMIEAVTARLAESKSAHTAGVVELSREAARPEGGRASSDAVAAEVGAAALAISPSEVFRAAQAQNKRVFLVNLILAVALASILIAGVAGVVVSGVVLGKATAAAAFGAVSILDVAGLALTKPFTVIQRASVTSQRLDLAHLRLQEQLSDCDSYKDPDARFRCRSRIWDKTQNELRALDPS